MRNAKVSSGFVKWDSLRDKETRNIRLTYGDVISIDAIQSATSTEHLNVLPNGSAEVQSFKAYVAQSRARESTYLVVSDGEERSVIMQRRALGSESSITGEDIWQNVARNLSRQPEKELATDLIDRANGFSTGTVRSLATAFQPIQQRAAKGQGGKTLHEAFAQTRDDDVVTRAASGVDEATVQQTTAVQEMTKRLTRPRENEMRKAVRAARRSMRTPVSRPRKEPRAMSDVNAQAEFADVLSRAGLRLKGAPIMDGKKHRVPVEGDRRGRLSGTYIGHLDGYPAGYVHNFKSGEEIRWKASQPTREMTPAERTELRVRSEAERTARESARRHGEAVVSHAALAVWTRGKPVRSHPYLTSKGIRAGDALRQDRRGNLLVPMRDADGRLWSLQTIDQTGGKLYLKGGGKQGAHMVLGEIQLGQPLLIAEGYATAATLYEITGLAVVAAFDSGNLMDVAQVHRERDPGQLIILAADNDHHLPHRPTPLPNVGLEKATAAAEAIGGIVLLPTFAVGEAGTDWNDYAVQHGRQAMRKALEVDLAAQGVQLPAVAPPAALPARQPVTQADRDAARERQTVIATAAKAASEAARLAQQPPQKGPRL